MGDSAPLMLLAAAQEAGPKTKTQRMWENRAEWCLKEYVDPLDCDTWAAEELHINQQERERKYANHGKLRDDASVGEPLMFLANESDADSLGKASLASKD